MPGDEINATECFYDEPGARSLSKMLAESRIAEEQDKKAEENGAVNGSRPIESEYQDDTKTTIGLIESIVTLARVLSRRDLSSAEVRYALADLRLDENIDILVHEKQPERCFACKKGGSHEWRLDHGMYGKLYCRQCGYKPRKP